MEESKVTLNDEYKDLLTYPKEKIINCVTIAKINILKIYLFKFLV